VCNEEVPNLILALLIILALGYAIKDALARSIAADDRSDAHRRADDEGFAEPSGRHPSGRQPSGDGKGRGPQGIDTGTER
jgi:hypothetical protein